MGNKSKPHYGRAPSRLASAYAGTAVYDNWLFEDPAVSNPDVWHRDIPTSPMRVDPWRGKFCGDTKKSPICANISQTTFPPKGEPADKEMSNVGCGTESRVQEDDQKLPFFAHGKELLDAIMK